MKIERNYCDQLIWLAAMVKNIHDIEVDGVKIAAIDKEQVQVLHGIERLAETLGHKPEFDKRDSTDYPMKAFFTHGGVHFIQLLTYEEFLLFIDEKYEMIGVKP